MDYSDDLTKVAEMVKGVTDSVVNLGLSMIAEEWENYDDMLRKRRDIRPDWEIIRTDEVSKLTSLGEVKYHKTYFRNKKTNERAYLLDRLMDFKPGERLTEDAVARILDEAADSSYRKGGLNASISGASVSKETVMDKLHPLVFPKLKTSDKKKEITTLYIDADEDHVALQYLDKDGERKESHRNTFMPKLIYLYEGIDAESKRHQLINVKYFGGGYEGTAGVEALWKEVYRYIEETYDEAYLKKIYVSGDGAEWIKTGAKMHEKAKFVLDKYHMHKYIIAATSHLEDMAQEARNALWEAIYGKNKARAEEVFDNILSLTEKETKRKAVEASKQYILGHWSAIMNGVRNKKDNIHCSAEGHVSHVYSERLSSRPLGWCVVGADKMARLRVYKKNGGDILELVRYQKQYLPIAAGAEAISASADTIMKNERKRKKELGYLADLPVYSIPYPQIKKMAALKNHLWGL